MSSDESVAVVACFSTLSAASLLVFAGSLAGGWGRSGLDAPPPAFALVPLAALAQAYDNGALAWAAASGAGSGLDAGSPGGVAALRVAVHSYIAPLLLLAAWEVCFTVFRARSVPIGCLSFDAGVSTRVVAATRVAFWLWAAALQLLLQTQAEGAAAAPAVACAGAGACARLRSGRIPVSGGFSWQAAADALPPASLLLAAGYMSRALWAYGSTASTDVHASCLNAWAAPAAATAALAAAYFATPADWAWPLAVNAALMLLAAALGLAAHLVQLNREQLARWRAELDAEHEGAIADAAREAQARLVRDSIERALASRRAELRDADAAGGDDGGDAPGEAGGDDAGAGDAPADRAHEWGAASGARARGGGTARGAAEGRAATPRPDSADSATGGDKDAGGGGGGDDGRAEGRRQPRVVDGPAERAGAPGGAGAPAGAPAAGGAEPPVAAAPLAASVLVPVAGALRLAPLPSQAVAAATAGLVAAGGRGGGSGALLAEALSEAPSEGEGEEEGGGAGEALEGDDDGDDEASVPEPIDDDGGSSGRGYTAGAGRRAGAGSGRGALDDSRGSGGLANDSRGSGGVAADDVAVLVADEEGVVGARERMPAGAAQLPLAVARAAAAAATAAAAAAGSRALSPAERERARRVAALRGGGVVTPPPPDHLLWSATSNRSADSAGGGGAADRGSR